MSNKSTKQLLRDPGKREPFTLRQTLPVFYYTTILPLLLLTQSVILPGAIRNAKLNVNVNNNSEPTEINYQQLGSGGEKEKKFVGWRRFGGILFCLLSSATMSFTALVVKLLPSYDPFTLTVWRYVGNILPAIPIILYLVCWKKQDIFGSIWPLLGKKTSRDNRSCFAGVWARGILGGAATVFRFSALQYLSLGDVAVITRCTPAFVIVLAYFFLQEKCSVVSIVSAILAILGVFILSRPPLLTGESNFDTQTLIGLGLSVGSLLCSSGTIIITRKLRKVNYALLILGFGIIGLIEGLALALGFGVFKFPEGTRDILLTICLSGLTFIGQVLSVLAFQFDDAGPISVMRTSYVLFAFIWQIAFLHIYPDLITGLGACIVLTGIILITLRKWVRTLPEDVLLRSRLNCLLE